MYAIISKNTYDADQIADATAALAEFRERSVVRRSSMSWPMPPSPSHRLVLTRWR